MGATDLSVIPGNEVIFPESVFRANTASDVPLTVQGAVSQSGDFFRIERSDGVILSRWYSNGALVVSGTTGVGIFGAAGVENRITNGALRVETGDVNRSGLVIRGMTSQAANLNEWQDGAGNILSRVGAGGGFIIGGPDATTQFASPSAFLNVQSRIAGNVVAVFRAAPGATTNIAEFQNSAGTVLTQVQQDGTVVLRAASLMVGSTTWYGGELNAQTLSAGRKGLVVRSSPSQTANLAEFQMADGTLRTRVAGDTGALGVNIHPTNIAWLAVTGVNASDVISVFRGLPSHTGNLTQWQDSAGNVMSSVAGDGNMYLAGDRVTTYGPNSTWGAYLRVGGNNSQPAAGRAAIGASNGNLHIDAATGGYGVYHNWYATSTLGTYFGNGASGQVGRIDGGGAMSAVSFTSTSRLDTKMNMRRVLESGPDDDKLMRLSAVKYNSVFSQEGADPLHSFVAEEVEEVMPEIVSHDENGEIVGINLTSLVTILTTQVQNLTARVRELEAR